MAEEEPAGAGRVIPLPYKPNQRPRTPQASRRGLRFIPSNKVLYGPEEWFVGKERGELSA